MDYTEFMLLPVDSFEVKCLNENPNYVNNPCRLHRVHPVDSLEVQCLSDNSNYVNNTCGLHRVHVTACGFLGSKVFK